jgi:hypothetical protein
MTLCTTASGYVTLHRPFTILTSVVLVTLKSNILLLLVT